ncbi:unnamed protein product [Didymodactylos carnosus]|uniref:Leucine-rich repeat-containing protein 63 n=1 Tax=Didymodactylos carnosus TaxID=1234261 RepID=A0A814HUZ4_9BILA|nr:unnamed protein product [Didymodactylos carnosus]CAF1015278.1 unnamed protein product [Didymodactylos carnosus]CAF3784352.1 unnamed protein product [Didymodactylos carnosus]CAF3786471.1 unnamed protein product [Didymodactylos carnosus]
MKLLRRPLRPHLKPLLLTDLNRKDVLSPLSSVSSSSTSPEPSDRVNTQFIANSFFDTDENQMEKGLGAGGVTPFQSEQILADNDMNEEEASTTTTSSATTTPIKTVRRKVLKPREYTQFSLHNRQSSNLRTLNRTPKITGPPPLLSRKTRSFNDTKIKYECLTYDDYYEKENDFTFNDFILHSALPAHQPCTLERAILSRYTYKQICEMIAEKIWLEQGGKGTIHVQTLQPNIQPFQNRVPMHQLVTEMALILKDHMSELLGSQKLKMGIRTLPTWKRREGAHTEILLYEKDVNETKSISQDSNVSLNMKRDTGAEIAVLDCLIKKGTHLDLRAFALEILPDISLMYSTLIAADLAYNCFASVPKEILVCTKLEHLYLKHNPIQTIPQQLQSLQSLLYLDLSFCDLRQLSDSLFTLINLRHLDVSYNRLTKIPGAISNLKNMRQFACDGNEITYFPSSLIRMDELRLITAKNTYLLPQLWNQECSTKPQKLTELSTVQLCKINWKRMLHKIPDGAKSSLFNAQPCDTCEQLRIGNGFRSVITFQNLFGIKVLPLLFISCTSNCMKTLLDSKATLTNEDFIALLKAKHK